MSEGNKTFHVEHKVQNTHDVPRGTIFCPVCNSEKTLLASSDITDHSVSGELFNIQNCAHCKVHFTHPIPEDLGSYYDSANYISHNNTQTGIINLLYQKFQSINLKYKLNLVKKFAKGAKWADYGSGSGAFCSYASQKGINIVGFEPNVYARSSALKKGIKTYDISEFEHTHTFDAITLWHVLEHIPDPNVAMQLFRDHLSESGILVLALPNHESFDAGFFGKYWAAWDVPRHLWHFNQSAIENFLTSNGFDLIKTSPLYLDSFYISALSLKYKSTSVILAPFIGLVSNFLGYFQYKPYSSMVYISRKRL